MNYFHWIIKIYNMDKMRKTKCSNLYRYSYVVSRRLLAFLGYALVLMLVYFLKADCFYFSLSNCRVYSICIRTKV